MFAVAYYSLEECFGDAHRDIEWMTENNSLVKERK